MANVGKAKRLYQGLRETLRNGGHQVGVMQYVSDSNVVWNGQYDFSGYFSTLQQVVSFAVAGAFRNHDNMLCV